MRLVVNFRIACLENDSSAEHLLPERIFDNGEMRIVWEDHNLWSQPQLLPAGHQPDIPTEPSEGDRDEGRAESSNGTVCQVHANNGKDLIIEKPNGLQESRPRPWFLFNRWYCEELGYQRQSLLDA